MTESVEPFPLTDLQHAYVVGELGGADDPAPALLCQEYAFGPGVTPDQRRLVEALARLRETHPALRLRMRPEGVQDYAPAGSEENPLVSTSDLTGHSAESALNILQELRSALPFDIPPHTAGCPFLIRLVLLPDGTSHLQIALRLTVFDGTTTPRFFTELGRCYADPGHRPKSSAQSFHGFVDERRRAKDTEAYQAAARYWHTRVETLPPAFELPRRAAGDTAAATSPLLLRRAHRLDPETWQAFQRNAAAMRMSPSAALFCLYTDCLLRWSGGRGGTLTVLTSQRTPETGPDGRPGGEPFWGCASNTVLVGVDAGEGSFAERGRARMAVAYTDFAAAAVSGVEVGRAVNRRTGHTGNPAPVVFSSALGLASGSPHDYLLPLPGAKLVHSALSTPTVQLDHQVYEEEGGLVCNFDHAAAAYPDGLVDDLAEHHRTRLLALAGDLAEWSRTEPSPLPERQLTDRRSANATGSSLPEGALHSFVLEAFARRPAAPAVLTRSRCLDRREIDRRSRTLAARLRRAGVGRDPERTDLVAVRLPKSPEQIIAVLGVLRAGAAYLPMAPSWPAARVEAVLEQSGAVALVGDADGCGTRVAVLPVPADTAEPEAEAAEGPEGAGAYAAADPDRTAYVIYTSGSTGTPKGVVLSHRSAVNTLRDLTRRFGLTQEDRVLAVSSLAFDLSVFDIFGLLGAGGSVIIPEDGGAPDPEAWGALCRRHGATVWNSVPALLDLTLEYLGGRAAELLGSLRLIMLSGDWVPLPLLERIAQVCPGARVVALGGATEAAIWSTCFWTEEQPAGWSSVPYGYPLANQTLHVLDADLVDVPTWVPGDLYIGGAGVATGYHHAPGLEKAAFVRHPATGERLYRTGDRARYRPGGILEFLGRQDDQVKVGGHRIELGELEARLAARPEVGRAVAVVAGSGSQPYLVAFVSPAPGARPDPDRLRAALAAELPSYMVPARVVAVDAIPLGANGKVDRHALLEQSPRSRATRAPADGVPPRTAAEATLLGLWRELLGPAPRGVTDDFFALGGNSLVAVRLFHRIGEAFGTSLPLGTLMRARTIAAQAKELAAAAAAGGSAGTGSELIALRGGAGDGDLLVLVHPVGGEVLCYQELLHALGADPRSAGAPVYGLRALGLLPGEPLAGSLVEMAAGYRDRLLDELPAGRIHLAGWSMGGTVAVQLAELLAAAGRPAASVTTVDAFTGALAGAPAGERERAAGFFSDLTGGADVGPLVPERAPGTDRTSWLCETEAALLAAGLLPRSMGGAELDRIYTVYANNSAILAAHRADGRAVRDRLTMVRARGTGRDVFAGLIPLDEALGGGTEGRGGSRPVWFDGVDHHSVIVGESARTLAGLLAGRLAGRR
ncbi:non-ribosomal peptide synthetase [Streptomyces sp. NBRC 110611]|uniref:non-ribosomal peptide synthetase n=1 Tax=Streptomyces sp. NBRC 110611 TaxID=1621259 RepID=UPI00083006DC|nr:non-ribosomal peptide synthetase [Streptomyces sp. NBRC 110611]GAU67434.1 non-ribosomal peptide synthetase [Streptomyces sp. NBRC 110611]